MTKQPLQNGIPQTRLMVRDHTYMVTPALLEAVIAYATYFRSDLERKLWDYLEEQAGRELSGEEEARRQQLVASVEREIKRAELIAQDIEFLRDELQHLYRWHFERLAEVFRKTRIALGRERIEDIPELFLVVRFVMAMLKAENPKFSEAKFITSINGREEVMTSESIQWQ